MLWYAFFMAFPAILIVQNISIFIFPFLLYGVYSLSGKFLNLRYFIQYVALIFGIGAIISVFNIPEKMPADSLSRSLEVLPNYLYWAILILFFTTYNQYLRLETIFKGILWGVLFSILYYFFLQNSLIAIPIFKQLSQNTFAFLLICYTPIVVWYTWKRFGFWLTLFVLVILTLSGFLSGSRAGSFLVLSGGVVTILLNRRSTWKTFIFALVGYLVFISLIDNYLVKETIYNLNKRTYSLIYDSDRTLEQDPSYLVRLAQLEKASIIFEKYPYYGIGLNNFTNYQVKLPGNFEGAKFVINKRGIDEKSAHNSYIGFLAEGGLFLLIPFVLLLGYCIFWFVISIRKLNPQYRPIFIGIIHMSIHLYFIYAIINVFAWFLIGLGCYVIVKHKA